MRSPWLLLPFLLACEKSTPTNNARPVTEPSASTSASAPPASSAAPASKAAAFSTPIVAPPPEANELAAGSNAFAIDFWQKVAPKRPGNLAFSPASISIAFAMTYPGAKGATASQMKKAMHFTGAPEKWGTFSQSLTSPNHQLKLRIANRLFGEKTYEFEQPYLELTKDSFDAPLERMDFIGATDPSRVAINKWVEDTTEQRIKELLPPASLDGKTRLVLVNAIYFLAEWATPFKKERTEDRPFEVDAKSKKTVPMMSVNMDFAFAKRDGVTVVALPYKKEEASMIVVLPDKKDGLADVEKGLTKAKLDAWLKVAKQVDIRLSLPRFEIATAAMQLTDEMASLGMSDAFKEGKADFTAIANPPNPDDRLHIAKVFHKAFVKVDEKGTEAAAATAMALGSGMGLAEPTVVDVDHPFLFFIVDKQSGLVLFMGRVVDPSVKG